MTYCCAGLQEVTPSIDDDAKRLDILQRLGMLLAAGLLGYTGLSVQACTCACQMRNEQDQLPVLPLLASCADESVTCTNQDFISLFFVCIPLILVPPLQPYGSFVSGMYTPSGDLDITIEGDLIRCD